LKINSGAESHQPGWNGLTHISTTCVIGWTYQFRVTLTHVSGLAGSTGRHAYTCTGRPPNQ
jgi:hypothetical protein